MSFYLWVSSALRVKKKKKKTKNSFRYEVLISYFFKTLLVVFLLGEGSMFSLIETCLSVSPESWKCSWLCQESIQFKKIMDLAYTEGDHCWWINTSAVILWLFAVDAATKTFHSLVNWTAIRLLGDVFNVLWSRWRSSLDELCDFSFFLHCRLIGLFVLSAF